MSSRKAVARDKRGRTDLQSQFVGNQQEHREQRAASPGRGQSHCVVIYNSMGEERGVHKKVAVGGLGEWEGGTHYNLRMEGREEAGARPAVREEQFQEEFAADIRTKRHGTSPSEVLRNTDASEHQSHSIAEGSCAGMNSPSPAGEQLCPAKEMVHVIASTNQAVSAGPDSGGKDTEHMAQLDYRTGKVARPELEGTTRQSHGGDVGNRVTPGGVQKDECRLASEPGEDTEHHGGKESGRATANTIETGTPVHSSLALTGTTPVGDAPFKVATQQVPFTPHMDPDVAANAIPHVSPRPEWPLDCVSVGETESSIGRAGSHSEAWLHSALEAAGEVGSYGLAFASASSPACEEQPLASNLSTEPSVLSDPPAPTIPDDTDVPSSVFVSDSQLNGITLSDLEHDQGSGGQEDATHLICGLISELSSLNRIVMAAHRDLESLRRGKTPKPHLRQSCCPRWPKP